MKELKRIHWAVTMCLAHGIKYRNLRWKERHNQTITVLLVDSVKEVLSLLAPRTRALSSELHNHWRGKDQQEKAYYRDNQPEVQRCQDVETWLLCWATIIIKCGFFSEATEAVKGFSVEERYGSISLLENSQWTEEWPWGDFSH